jgi:hypothetical protein
MLILGRTSGGPVYFVTAGVPSRTSNTWPAAVTTVGPRRPVLHTAVLDRKRDAVWGGQDGSGPLASGGALRPRSARQRRAMESATTSTRARSIPSRHGWRRDLRRSGLPFAEGGPGRQLSVRFGTQSDELDGTRSATLRQMPIRRRIRYQADADLDGDGDLCDNCPSREESLRAIRISDGIGFALRRLSCELRSTQADTDRTNWATRCDCQPLDTMDRAPREVLRLLRNARWGRHRRALLEPPAFGSVTP